MRVARRTGDPTARNERDPLGDGWSEHGGAVRRDGARDLRLPLSHLTFSPVPQPLNIPLVFDKNQAAHGE
jgi:hypothetical protein